MLIPYILMGSKVNNIITLADLHSDAHKEIDRLTYIDSMIRRVHCNCKITSVRSCNDIPTIK